MNALNTVARLIGYFVLFSALALAMLVLREYLETKYRLWRYRKTMEQIERPISSMQ